MNGALKFGKYKAERTATADYQGHMNYDELIGIAHDEGLAAFKWFERGGFSGKEKPTNPYEPSAFNHFGWSLGFDEGEREYFKN